ncbi:MAG: glycosyltransferase, partial [Campylobacter sp.]|nr:glycosyltransferase [Campylobacter sp.]
MARIGFLSHADMSLHFFRRAIMQELKSLGHDVFAIAPQGAYTSLLSRDFNAVTYELDKASLNPIKVLSNSNKLSKILRELNLDLLQTSAHKSNVFGTFAARKAGIAHILNLIEGLGSFYIDNDVKTRLVRFAIETLYKRSLGLSEGCIFVNDADPKYFLSRNLIAQNKIIKIKSVGVDTRKFDENSVQSVDLGDKKIVLMIGRAMWHKGVREFYEAAQLLKERSDCEFVYVGEGFEGNKSTADIKFLKSGNVRYLGARDDIPQLLKSANVVALPS